MSHIADQAGAKDTAPVGLGKRFLGSTIWMSASQLVTYSVSFGANIVLARLLAPEDFGVFALGQSILAIVYILGSWRFSVAIIQAVEMDQKYFDTAYLLSLGLGLVLFALTAALSVLLRRFYSVQALRILVILSGLGSVRLLSDCYSATLRREMRFRELSLVQLGIQAASLTGAVALASLGFGMWSLVGKAAIRAIGGFWGMRFISPWRLKWRFDAGAAKQLLKFGGQMFVSNGLESLLANSQSLIVGTILGTTALGHFDRAIKLSRLGQAVAGPAVNQVLGQMTPRWYTYVVRQIVPRRSDMNSQAASRLHNKTSLHAIQIELQSGYNLSPVEAQVLARRVQQLVDEQAGFSRQAGQITYQAIAIDEPPGKPLEDCRKVPVHLTVMADEDAHVWANKGPLALRRLRVHRIVYEATMQGGALSQEDVACILGISTKSVKRIFAYFRQQGEPLPSRGEIQDMGRGVSHKIPVIGRYVQDLSFSRISRELGNHGISSMARYLHHFALVMILEDRSLTPQQMRSIIGISENLIRQYRELYAELNVPEHARALERLKQTVFHPPSEPETAPDQLPASPARGQKGGAQ